MSVGRVVTVHKDRLGCSVSTTVAGNDVVTLVPVDSFVVGFAEDGGQFLHQPTGDIYDYDSADDDAETITLTAGLPTGKTLTAGDALYVYPRSDDYYADVAIDDVASDMVSARVPQMLRTIIEEGTEESGQGPLVRLNPGGEGWEITDLDGEEPVIQGIDHNDVSSTVSGGAGQASFAHDLGQVPATVVVTNTGGSGASARLWRRVSADDTSSTFAVEFRDATGTLTPNGVSVRVQYIALA